MSRSIPWRRVCPDKISKRIERASQAQIYLLRTTGPTGFLLTAEGDERKFKVFLGDPHSCTCPVFQKEKDLCVHILWVLVKKFRVPKKNSVVYQLGLVEREIGEVVRGLFTNPGNNKKTEGSVKNEETDSREKLSKKEVTEDDVCPICQEDLLGKTQLTTYCKYGCGNSIHIKCMKIWAEHQKSSGETIIKCPLCRVDFGSFEVIKKEYLKSWRTRQKQDVHMGTVCAQCNMTPITGKCYRCNVCPNYQLCKNCFASDSHYDHPFVFRQKSNQRWRPASKFQAIPSAVAGDLQSREITEDDYNLLLQLDGSSVGQSSVPGHILNSFPVEKITSNSHRLTNNDEKCGVCYLVFKPSQTIRILPCQHEFHRNCIDSWLSNEHNTCPVDGQTVYSLESGHNSRQRSTGGSSITSRNQENSKTSSKKVLAVVKRQKRSQTDQEHHLPQNFSLNGLGLRQRNTQGTSEISAARIDRTNSAPVISNTQVIQPTDSSSNHVMFATKMLGRAAISTEQVLKYGRHSGDSRFRRCMGLKSLSERKIKNGKSQSLNDISLSGRAISSHNIVGDLPLINGACSQQNAVKGEGTVIRTSIATSSPEYGFSRVQVDI